MPELPEVHALVADLSARLVGRTMARLDLVSFSALKTFDPPASAMSDRVITAIDRHGKFLDFSVGDLHLVMHLARAGWIRWRDSEPAPRTRPTSGPLTARLVLDDGSGFDVTEAGTKKSVAIWIVRSVDEIPQIERLGPDPLDPAFTLEVFTQILASAGRTQIKGVLRDQSRIAGIGNAYSDEILHVARMSPYKPASMTPDEAARLYDATRETLLGAIERSEGVSAANLKREKKTAMRVHGRAGQECLVCGDTVRQVIFADRTLEYCPSCQTGGKPLADRVLSRLLK
ncbi:endonuclease VIII [Clavibacter michiganensis]|nr:DNA-formamidopyrimidine glycosylase family protein [Clavibacter michiganensis]PPF61754.1 endonuclease VIII [Clavibacter michiganensis]